MKGYRQPGNAVVNGDHGLMEAEEVDLWEKDLNRDLRRGESSSTNNSFLREHSEETQKVQRHQGRNTLCRCRERKREKESRDLEPRKQERDKR